jgi:hypothetical protein
MRATEDFEALPPTASRSRVFVCDMVFCLYRNAKKRNRVPLFAAEEESMGGMTDWGGRKWGSIVPVAMAVGFGVLGVVMVHHPMIFSGFGRIQGDRQDTRLIHYLLEHSYLWVTGDPGHRDLWSPPFHYPAQNVAAYSDLFLTLGPVYWFYRVVGASLDLSFVLWMVSMTAMNYAAGLLLFGRALGFGLPASVAGASLVAFCAPRVNQMEHQQLLGCFYVLIAVYALARLAGEPSMDRWSRLGLWLLAVLAGVAQLYGGVYLGWFLGLGVGTAAVGALVLPSCRPVLRRILRRDLLAMVAAAAVGLLLLQPFLTHYGRAAAEAGEQYLPTLRALHPRVWSYLDMGPGNWLWGWASGRGPLHVEHLPAEHYLGIGLLTAILCAAGLYLSRDRPLCQLAAVTAAILWLGTTFLPGNLLSMIACGVLCYGAAALFHETDDPVGRSMGLAAVLIVVLLRQIPNRYTISLGLILIILGLIEIHRSRDEPRRWIVPGLAIGAISIRLFPLEVILIGLALIVPVAGVVAYLNRPRRWEVAMGASALLVIFLVVITFLDRRPELIFTMVVAPTAVAMGIPGRWRPAPRILLRAMLIAIPFMVLFYAKDSIWLAYSRYLPGATAMRAVGRVVLILVLPAALGLASMVERLSRRGRSVAAWFLILAFLAEQGVTTDASDAAANRARIHELARQVDRSREAFYYHPCGLPPDEIYQIDAMWVSLVTGVPTINGLTGYAPRDWFNFFVVDTGKPDLELKDVLAAWEAGRGLSPDRIQWIGADCPPKSPDRRVGKPPIASGGDERTEERVRAERPSP